MRMGGRSVRGDEFVIHPEIPLIAKLFVNVPETRIWADESCARREFGSDLNSWHSLN